MIDAVLAGGLLCDERLWTGVRRGLNGRAHTIVFDRETTLMDMARSILCASPKRFELVGYSMGGMAALIAAAAAPERIGRLLLVGTHAEPETADRRANRARQIATVERVGLEQFVASELLPLYFGSDHARNSHSTLAASMAQVCGVARFRRHVQALASRPDPSAFLQRLTMPVIVISGSDDRIARPEWAQAMAARLPSSVFCTLPGCGHMVPLERAAELAGYLDGAA